MPQSGRWGMNQQAVAPFGELRDSATAARSAGYRMR